MARIESTSTTIFTITSVIPLIGGNLTYVSNRLKKFTIRSKMMARVAWLAELTFAAQESHHQQSTA
jgi:hypothetical protein